MSNFIKLTLDYEDGGELVVRHCNIAAACTQCAEGKEFTYINMVDGEFYTVKETPYEIFNLIDRVSYVQAS